MSVRVTEKKEETHTQKRKELLSIEIEMALRSVRSGIHTKPTLVCVFWLSHTFPPHLVLHHTRSCCTIRTPKVYYPPKPPTLRDLSTSPPPPDSAYFLVCRSLVLAVDVCSICGNGICSFSFLSFFFLAAADCMALGLAPARAGSSQTEVLPSLDILAGGGLPSLFGTMTRAGIERNVRSLGVC